MCNCCEARFSVFQLFSIIVFGCLADKSYSDETDHCLINDSDACNLGVGVGVVAMLMCLAAYTKDFMYAFMSNHQVSWGGVLCKLINLFCAICLVACYNKQFESPTGYT